MAASKPSFTPTPAAIRRMCRSIQAGWNRREREKRAPWDRPHSWTVPQIDNLDMPPGEDGPRDWD